MSGKYKDTELGKIPLDWDIVSFDTVAELRHGYQFRNYDFTDEGIKILKITQIKGDGTIDLSSCSYIDKDRVAKFERVIINKGDILVALTGATIGKIAKFNSEELVLQNYRVGNFFPLNEHTLSKDYLFHFLRSKLFFHQILARQTQSAQQNIGKDEINNMLIFLPSNIHEQKAIAKILTAFDDKIELLQEQNKTLEATAQTIFKEWFGKYQIGNELPEGWRVGKLGELANHIKENIKPFEFSYSTFIHYSLPAYDDGLVPVTEKGKLIKSNKYLVKDKTFLVSKLNPFTPRIWTIFNSADNHICSTEFQVLKPIKTFYFSFLHSFLNSKFYTREISKNIQGTSSSHQRIRPEDIFNLELIIPSYEDINSFEETVGSFILKKEINHNQIQTLKQTRDTLLPKLMSGQLRVDEFKESAV